MQIHFVLYWNQKYFNTAVLTLWIWFGSCFYYVVQLRRCVNIIVVV